MGDLNTKATIITASLTHNSSGAGHSSASGGGIKVDSGNHGSGPLNHNSNSKSPQSLAGKKNSIPM